jgi:hypothetical protein
MTELEKAHIPHGACPTKYEAHTYFEFISTQRAMTLLEVVQG